MGFLDKLLAGRDPQAYALLRIVAGFLFIFHGSQKLFDFPLEFPYPMSPLMQAAGLIEVIGGAMIMLGLFSRPVAFLCSGTMAVAYWMAHGMRDLFPYIKWWRTLCSILLHISFYCLQGIRYLERGPNHQQ